MGAENIVSEAAFFERSDLPFFDSNCGVSRINRTGFESVAHYAAGGCHCVSADFDAGAENSLRSYPRPILHDDRANH